MSKPGTQSSALIDSKDFVSTLLAATGVLWFSAKPLDRESFLPQIRGKKVKRKDCLFSHFDPHPSCKANLPPTPLAWDHTHKLYLDGRFYEWTKELEEKNPLAAGVQTAKRKQLQAKLDEMERIKPPVCNRFKPDGKPPY